MLEEVLRHINNRFDRDRSGAFYGTAEGAFAVEGGTMEVEGLLDGQYFWVEGSVLNDGLHLYPDEDMADEEFEGRVVFLRVPKAVSDIADEIAAWCEEHADEIASPYQSESFGGYSYSKGGSGGAETPSEAWKSVFGGRLNPFRKMARDWV